MTLTKFEFKHDVCYFCNSLGVSYSEYYNFLNSENIRHKRELRNLASKFLIVDGIRIVHLQIKFPYKFVSSLSSALIHFQQIHYV